jgi:hypothetical protein
LWDNSWHFSGPHWARNNRCSSGNRFAACQARAVSLAPYSDFTLSRSSLRVHVGAHSRFVAVAGIGIASLLYHQTVYSPKGAQAIDLFANRDLRGSRSPER